MEDKIFLTAFILISISVVYFRKFLARNTVHQYEVTLEWRKHLGYRDEFNKSKMLKDLERGALIGGISFSIIGLLLLIGMLMGVFVEVNPKITTVVATSSPLVSLLGQIWNFSVQILIIGIFLYVLYWHGFFKWLWR